MTQKAKAVQLQSAFLEFLETAQVLGYDLDPYASIKAHPKSDSKNTVTNNVNLTVGDFIDKREQELFSTTNNTIRSR